MTVEIAVMKEDLAVFLNITPWHVQMLVRRGIAAIITDSDNDTMLLWERHES